MFCFPVPADLDATFSNSGTNAMMTCVETSSFILALTL